MIKQFIKYAIIGGIALVAILAAIILLPNVKSGEKEEYLLIPEGADFAAVMDSIDKKESIKSDLSFRIAAQLAGYPKKIKEGRYALTPGIDNLHLINNLLKGRQTPVRFTFNNIRTKEDLCRAISNQLMVDSLELITMLNDEDFLTQYALNSETAVCMFIPNTYEVYWTISATKLLQRMYDESELFWTEERLRKAQKLHLSKAEVITLASIVEEESNRKSEKPAIAGLYLNRLRIGMKLQADPTVKFALKDFSLKRIFEKHLFTDSPYNTYKYEGLPPGPIRVPSIESIDAVLNYKSHDYLFMCVDPKKGEHFFTKSYNEHLNMADSYQKNLDKRGIK